MDLEGKGWTLNGTENDFDEKGNILSTRRMILNPYGEFRELLEMVTLIYFG